MDQLERSRAEEIEDWRFLAAFSIHNVGKGGCERLLKHHRLADIFDLTIKDFIKIDGFAETTATLLHDALVRIQSDFDFLMSLGFNLSETPLVSEKTENTSPIAGKTIVFTGSMQHGKRDDMKKEAKTIYQAIVASSVTGKTDYLVCGDKVGKAKITAAESKGVTVISEEDYLKLLTTNPNIASGICLISINAASDLSVIKVLSFDSHYPGYEDDLMSRMDFFGKYNHGGEPGVYECDISFDVTDQYGDITVGELIAK